MLGHRVIALHLRDRIFSPADALAVVHTVEQRFGRVAECRFSRDALESSRYQATCYLSFADVASYDRVPQEEPVLLQVKVPPAPELSSGGPGLSDIAPFFEHGESSRNEDASRSISFLVSHSSHIFQTHKASPPAYTTRPKIAFDLHSNFVRWGGFAPLEPHPTDSNISRTQRVLGDASIDRPNMRYQLQHWTTALQQGLPRKEPSEIPRIHASPAIARTPFNSSTSLPWLSPSLEPPKPSSIPPTPTPVVAASPIVPASISATSDQPATNHREQSRYARKALQLEPDYSTFNEKVMAANTVNSESVLPPPPLQVAAVPKKKPRKKTDSPPARSTAFVPPVEVEEQRAGMAARLRRMVGDWI